MGESADTGEMNATVFKIVAEKDESGLQELSYRITPHIRPGPYIRYKAHPSSKKMKILIYIRPGPYKSVIRPPSRYKAHGEPYNGKGWAL